MFPDATEAAALVEILRRAARNEVMPRFRRLAPGAIRQKRGPHDLVTDADLAAEEAIAREVARAFPGAVVVGEEGVAADPARLRAVAAAEVAVILDPVDGTWNFARGLPLFGMILAVTLRGETSFGLLHDPVTDSWISARRGHGAWEARGDGSARRLGVAPAPEGEAAGFAPLHHLAPGPRLRLVRALVPYGPVTSLRCSCHEWRVLAAGGAQFRISNGLAPWDDAAGVLVHAEAGGTAALTDGRAYAPALRSGTLVAAAEAGACALLAARVAASLGGGDEGGAEDGAAGG